MASIFTKIVRGEIPCHKLWEDDRFFAFLDIHPIQPGHTLIVPKQEIDNVLDMPDELYSGLFLAGKRLGERMREALGCKRVVYCVLGFDVPHVHLHLVPANHAGDFPWRAARQASNEELAALAEKLRRAVER